MLDRLRLQGVDSVLLPPLVIKRLHTSVGSRSSEIDARLELSLPGESKGYPFVLEVKSRATPESIQLAMSSARNVAKPGEFPMIHVPFLGPEQLARLEKENVSGYDLCGNGLIVVPRRLYVLRSGAPNLYPDSRPLSNPYSGRSAMVARMLLLHPHWSSLTELHSAIQLAGVNISLPQTSKAVNALREDLILPRTSRSIIVREPLRLLDNLAKSWHSPQLRRRLSLRLRDHNWPQRLNAVSRKSIPSPDPHFRWAVTGESSVPRYASFAQSGPTRVAVSNMERAEELFGGERESVPTFADLELIETQEPGYYFANEVDETQTRWASKLQTYLELRIGDARQQEAAGDLRTQILGIRQS